MASKHFTLRLPESLWERVELRASIQSRKPSELVLEAIERGWDAPGMSGEPVNTEPYRPHATTKAALLASIPGLKTAATLGDEPAVPLTDVESETLHTEIPICGIKWWEEGEQYECLMDKGHKSPKHGLHGKARNITDG